MVDCTNQYWSSNLKCLYNNICDFPSEKNTKQSNINAITRILIFISILVMCINFKYGVLFLFLSLIIMWCIIKYMNNRKENYELNTVNVECKRNKCSTKNVNLYYKDENDDCVRNDITGYDDNKETIMPVTSTDTLYTDKDCNDICEDDYELLPGFGNSKYNPPLGNPNDSVNYVGNYRLLMSEPDGLLTAQLNNRVLEFYDNSSDNSSQLKNLNTCISNRTQQEYLYNDSKIRENRFLFQSKCPTKKCENSQYGCCDDQHSIKQDAEGSNCKTPINVFQTEIGQDVAVRPEKYINPPSQTVNTKPCYLSCEKDVKDGCLGTNSDKISYIESNLPKNSNYVDYGIPLNAPIQKSQQDKSMKSINQELYTDVIQQPNKNGENGVFATTDIVVPLSSNGYSSDMPSTGYKVEVDDKNNKYYIHSNGVANYNEYKIDTQRPNQMNVTDTRGVSYGDPDRCYVEDQQVKYYYDDIDSVILPKYMSSNPVENIYRDVHDKDSNDVRTTDINTRMTNDFVNSRNNAYNSVAFSTVNSLQNISKRSQQKLMPVQNFAKNTLNRTVQIE